MTSPDTTDCLMRTLTALNHFGFLRVPVEEIIGHKGVSELLKKMKSDVVEEVDEVVPAPNPDSPGAQAMPATAHSPPPPQKEYSLISCAVECIGLQKKKEGMKYIWEGSRLKDIVNIQKNNTGCVGEKYLQMLCEMSSVPSEIDGVDTKQVGGGNGDGYIKSPENTVEIKTAYQGAGNAKNFQHELAEFPWKAKYMCFIDISAKDCIYITLFKNWDEDFYKKSGLDNSCKCEPYFPTKSITWRKGEGNFKLDTTIKINDENVEKEYTLKITENTTIMDVTNYINKTIT